MASINGPIERELGPNAGRETTEMGQEDPFRVSLTVTQSAKEAVTAIRSGSRNAVTARQRTRGEMPNREGDR
jgi:hypothetical protein